MLSDSNNGGSSEYFGSSRVVSLRLLRIQYTLALLILGNNTYGDSILLILCSCGRIIRS